MRKATQPTPSLFKGDKRINTAGMGFCCFPTYVKVYKQSKKRSGFKRSGAFKIEHNIYYGALGIIV
jgi:hypothetical protein